MMSKAQELYEEMLQDFAAFLASEGFRRSGKQFRTWYGGVGGRIGDFLPKKQDTWWELNEGTSPQFVAAQIKAVVAAYGLPFLRQLRFKS